MDDDLQARADERLSRHLEKSGAADPRDHCRRRLRELRTMSEAAYEEAVEQYRTSVLPRVADGSGNPLQIWLEYAVLLATLVEEGRTVVVDSTGRARPYEGPASVGGELVLHLPDSQRSRALLVAVPSAPTRAQRAAHDLLVQRKQRLEEPS